MRKSPARVARSGFWLLPALAYLLIVAPLSAAPRLEAGACPDYRFLPGVGHACRAEDGLLRIKAPDGSILTSHGADPVAGTTTTVKGPARNPACATGAAGDFYIVPIYARAIDDADEFATKAASVRSVVQQANGMVNATAVASGVPTDMRVLCSNGTIAVQNVSLPTPLANTDFSTIVADLKRAGYSNGRLKYLVYFDERLPCGCAGMANLSSDDRLSADNRNNGNVEPMYAASFGYLSGSTLLHELSHTMGAVQNSAPHTTGTGHCTDGRDVMCYNDGGPRGSSYSTSRCGTEVFDCGRDDYFNTNPASGSYLATHWNLGSKLNRYMAFDPGGAPVMNAVACPGKAGLRRPYTCVFRALDTSSGVAYYVNWGDGSSTVRVPKTGYFAPGTYQTADHTYTGLSTYTMRVYAIDNGAPARASGTLTAKVQVVRDSHPPTIKVFDPAPGVLYKGCGSKGVYPLGRPGIAQRACLRTQTSDSATGVAGIWIFVNGRAAGFTRSNIVEFNVKGPALGVPVRIEVRDYAGYSASVTVLVDILA